MTVFRGHPQPVARGFTLVEILTVIVIIGILAAIAIPAITGALKTGKRAAIRTEVEGLAQAVEAYKLKYGDYPPDFSSWPLVQAHYNKIFPDIALTELTLLFRLCDDENDSSTAQTDATPGVYVPSAMDRAEALIWSVGGFSSDAQLPFTGAGGPLALLPNVTAAPGNATNPAVWQYNSARDNSLLDLEIGSLTLSTPDSTTAITYANRVQSTDDIPNATVPLFVDVFPVYTNAPDSSPYVYFDARTYRFDAGGGQLNGFATVLGGTTDAVRPVFDTRVNANLPYPSASSTTYGSRTNSLAAWEFLNPRTFQILSPGLDGHFGIVADADGGPDPTNDDPVYWQYPAGTMLRAIATADDPQDLIVANVNRYGLDNLLPPSSEAVIEGYERDNMANFTKKTFEDDLP